MELVKITSGNIEKEHLCCALSDKKGAAAKRGWLKQNMKQGYTFQKLDGQGKAFIEYVPAEHAWAPVDAEGYLFIDCFWVSGRFAGQGHASRLLDACIADAKAQGKKGLVAVSSQKKMAFLSDPVFYRKKGFMLADTAPPYYELLHLPFEDGAGKPSFKDCAKTGRTEKKGIVIYYDDHCPWNAKYIPLLEKVATERGVQFEAVKLQTEREAQEVPNPFPTYAVFRDGQFVTNEMFSEKKFIKFLEEGTA